MSRFDDLVVDLRRAESYLPPCPLCSHLGVHDFTDLILGPSHYRCRREVHEAVGSRIAVWRQSLTACCSLSRECPWFKTAAESAQWWREQRAQPLTDIAQDNRRRLTLERLAAANLEALCAES